MRIFLTAFVILLVSIPHLLYAEWHTIKGRVLNDDSQPLEAVVVQVKGAKAITATGASGTFSITVLKKIDTLVFSLQGYEKTEYVLNPKNATGPITIILRLTPAADRDIALASAIETRADVARMSKMYVGRASAGYKVAEMAVSKEAIVSRNGLFDKKPGNRGSGTLTAGEVSDFKKWKLWEDYNAGAFTEQSAHWRLALKERYCVQVQNQDNVAVAGEKVVLLDAGSKDTVWEAVTDNTGKAELWANVGSSNGMHKNAYSISCGQSLITNPLVFENGINRVVLNQACNVPEIVELAFVVDATGSMSDEINYLQEELQDVIGKTTSRYKEVQLRSAAVFYRDHSDAYLTRHIDFTTAPSELIRFIKEQAAAGGGDYPEAVEAALATAIDSLHWSPRARTRILFLVLDAPPHDEARGRIAGQIRMAAKKGIRIVPVVCSGIDKSTEYLMRSIALATNGTYVFLTDDSGIGKPHIKPTTDQFSVELLNDLLQRVIREMVFVPRCGETKRAEPVSEPLKVMKVAVFPNPSTGVLNIKASEAINEILVTDFTGKVLMRPTLLRKQGRIRVDLGQYPSGTYLLKYQVEGKGWGAEKILIVH